MKLYQQIDFVFDMSISVSQFSRSLSEFCVNDFSKCRFWKLNWYAYENLKIIWPVASFLMHGGIVRITSANWWLHRRIGDYINEMASANWRFHGNYFDELENGDFIDKLTSANWRFHRRTFGTPGIQNYFHKYRFVIYIVGWGFR